MGSVWKGIRKRVLAKMEKEDKHPKRRRFKRKRFLSARKAARRKADIRRPRAPHRTRLEEAQLRAQRGGKHGVRELLCTEVGVKNTGRQWVRLHKRLRREDTLAAQG